MSNGFKKCAIIFVMMILCGQSKISWSAAEGTSETQELHREIKELEKRLSELETEKSVKPPVSSNVSGDIYSKQAGTANLRLIDISFDGLFFAGGSTEDDHSLQTLQGGDHDPKKNGFTLAQAELSLAGAVDPYFTGEGHIVYKLDPLTGESEFELEEAFLTTQSLPVGLQIKAGLFLTEFGRMNSTHPHAWLWSDQPVILTRLMGPDGLRSPGMRVSWLMPLPWFVEFYAGVQNANGETLASFLGNDETVVGFHPFSDPGIDGPEDLLYSTRLTTSFDLGETVTAQLGASGLFGPNYTGQQGRTYIYGGDVTVKWKPVNNFRGWPFVTFEAEAMQRFYQADNFYNMGVPMDASDDIFVSSEVLKDYGLYAQLLYGFRPRWAAGMRYEWASGDNQAFFNRQADPYRDDRQRFSPLLTFYPSEFSRLRLQYNYDRADHLSSGDAHSVWTGVEFLFGAHAAHRF